MRLTSTKPARTPPLGRRSLTGRTATSRGSAVFESALERDWFIQLDFDPAVTRFMEQPFTLTYVLDGAPRTYTPDVLAEFATTSSEVRTVVYEVKYRDDLRDNWADYRPRFAAANHHCRSRGWRFEIVTEREIRTSFLENATFLRRYRTIPDQPLIRMQLLYTLRALGPTTPQALLAASYACDSSRMPALSILWNLIATRRIACDLRQKLAMNSLIRPVE